MSSAIRAIHLGKGIFSVKDEKWEVTGRYALEEFLGSGSYGGVCLGRDKTTQQQVAIKKVNGVFQSSEDALRILREISILRHLDHPNVVKVVDVIPPTEFDQHGLFRDLYIIFEYAGSDLLQHASRGVQLTIEQVQWLLAQFVHGLSYLHACGVIHRDLKPANVIIDQALNLKIADFGLARVMDAAATTPEVSDAALNAEFELGGSDSEDEEMEDDGTSKYHNKEIASPTADGAIPALTRALSKHVVTRWYRAPEVIVNSGMYNESIDVWSVGCIFAEMLAMMQPIMGSKVLFRGACCFPLSPRRSGRPIRGLDPDDQLSVIFRIMGTPTQGEVAESVLEPPVQDFLNRLPVQKGTGLKNRLPHAPEDALDLLTSLLQFSYVSRMKLSDAAQHPFIAAAMQAVVAKYTWSAEVRAIHSFLLKLPLDHVVGQGISRRTRIANLLVEEAKAIHTESEARSEASSVQNQPSEDQASAVPSSSAALLRSGSDSQLLQQTQQTPMGEETLSQAEKDIRDQAMKMMQ